MGSAMRMRDLVGTAGRPCLLCGGDGATLREVRVLGVGGKRQQHAFLCDDCAEVS